MEIGEATAYLLRQADPGAETGPPQLFLRRVDIVSNGSEAGKSRPRSRRPRPRRFRPRKDALEQGDPC
ncbi:hypothetical protein F2Q70_00023853 [Brassica cretica]|uniref:Uncharacterized protein n=1 Tax=Brassica cretica TaxID=69181 RepID=A0A8S9GSG8_BRACR|nr:hypothetical protein F2Q70_00023853 [Brassica cretica]KAF3610109.1 hypothetical protein DY000_02051292 [Brassica cretica]